MSQIIHIDGNYENEIFDTICQTIQDDGVVIMPCDTIYGFLAKDSAGPRVRQIKNRDEKPFLYLISEISQLEYFDIDYTKYEDVLNKNWPGNITFILSNRSGSATFGVRMPNYPIISEIIKKVGMPLLSTSVNVSGSPALNEGTEIIETFGNKADLVVIDSQYKPANASTIVSLVDSQPKILRQGDRVFNEK